MTLFSQDTTCQSTTCAASSGTGDHVDLDSILHFNFASSPPPTVIEPNPAMENLTSPQAPLFNNDEQPIFGDYSAFFYQDDAFGNTAPYANMAVDNTKWCCRWPYYGVASVANFDYRLLQGMLARLVSLEAAVAGGNARIAHLDNRIMALTNRTEEVQQSIDKLTHTMKEFVVALVTKVFGNQASDLETNGAV